MDKVLKINATLSTSNVLNASISNTQTLNANLGFSGIAGNVNYETQVYNRPSINYIELLGNKNSEELGLEPTISDISDQDIDNIIYGG